ncbi:hypothetical protein QF031_002692 [Pseudarthrobacter defluvii]|uniref:hypothetical protein n=1 Tax=Pseudarthrobacter defluvii TaxID=410837 RepID=UPI00277FFCB9|nr:hypothetical protein [Pseudarthrobacter defluvii]MDQ0769943.1 hypothetical protein [Pseudarthrobacter defluvii]
MRRAVLAGAVAVALTGAGSALAWSATSTPTPSPSQSASQSAPGNSGSAPGHNKPGKAQRAQPLHGESVVKNADGTFQTVLEQRGTVESVSDSAITVKSEDGFTQTYNVNGDTKITRIPPAVSSGVAPSPGATPSGGKSDDGKRLKPTDGTIADIAAGDTVRIAGVKDGDKATAKRIVKGAGEGPGMGLGRGPGHSQGLGHGKGLGQKMGKGNHQDEQDS